MSKKKFKSYMCRECGLTFGPYANQCDEFGCGGVGPPTKPSKKEFKRLVAKEKREWEDIEG